MEKIEAEFQSRLDKTGIPPTGKQLLSYAIKNKLSGVSLSKIYQYLRERAPVVGPFSRSSKIKSFQTIGVPRPGLYFLDYGEFHKGWANHNDGCTGFLVAVENLTNRLFVLPTKGKGTRQWLEAIDKFVEVTRDVRVIFSDRDAVAQSEKFRKQIEDEYGIKWHFLKKGSKSYLAERYIGFAKTKLSQALDFAESVKGDSIKRWVDYVLPLCEEYNKERILGTNYTRKSVHPRNFNHFVEQLFAIKAKKTDKKEAETEDSTTGQKGSQSGIKNSDDPELEFNGFKLGPFVNDNWNKKIFKFNLGDRVRVLRKSNWKDMSERSKGAFEKVSGRGAFGNKAYTINYRQLRSDKTRSVMIPVYGLEEFDSQIHFYEKELVKISNSGATNAAAAVTATSPML